MISSPLIFMDVSDHEAPDFHLTSLEDPLQALMRQRKPQGIYLMDEYIRNLTKKVGLG
jgi:hypothetical protein